MTKMFEYRDENGNYFESHGTAIADILSGKIISVVDKLDHQLIRHHYMITDINRRVTYTDLSNLKFVRADNFGCEWVIPDLLYTEYEYKAIIAAGFTDLIKVYNKQTNEYYGYF